MLKSRSVFVDGSPDPPAGFAQSRELRCRATPGPLALPFVTAHLVALGIDANDPPRLARFWAGVLGRETADDPDEPEGGAMLPPGDDTGFHIRFPRTQEPNAGPHQMHFDLTSTSLADQQETVARALALGGRHLDVGQLPEEGHVVLADPEGNEFCVLGPDNDFTAGCGVIGALSCDGSQALGYFWSEALGWPLVWDQDEETAIQSPRGGSKIAWGGPPVNPRTGKNRLHLEIAPPADGDQQAEVERLLALGATRVDVGRDHVDRGDVDRGDVGWVVLADPDGNELWVLPSTQELGRTTRSAGA